jgi:hypothetical protein
MLLAANERALRRAFWSWFVAALSFYLVVVCVGAASSSGEATLDMTVFAVVVLGAAFLAPRAATAMFMLLLVIVIANLVRVDFRFSSEWRVALIALSAAAFGCTSAAFRAASALRRVDAERDAREQEYERRERWLAPTP